MNSRLLWFALGVGAYWAYDHFFPSPKMNAGRYRAGRAGGG
jgi:hypothetical protein